jgi:hypothetical protein
MVLSRVCVVILLAGVFWIPRSGRAWPRESGGAGSKTGELRHSPQPETPHTWLNRMVGKWDVMIRYSLSSGSDRTGTAKCEANWIGDGRYLEQKYFSQVEKNPFITTQYWGYDEERQKFIGVRMDPMDTGLLSSEGVLGPDRSTLTLLGDRLDPLTSKVRRLRWVTSFINEERFLEEVFQTGDDGKEEKRVSMLHVRQKE